MPSRTLSPPPPSSVTSHIAASTANSSTPTHAPHLHHLAAQVLHNLTYEHGWRGLRVHTHEPSGIPFPSSNYNDEKEDSESDEEDMVKASRSDASYNVQGVEQCGKLLPRPVISGQPPRRIYTHPDLQRALLKRGLREEDLPPETIWVLPTMLKERWSLKDFAAVFDGLPEREGVVFDDSKSKGGIRVEKQGKKAEADAHELEETTGDEKPSWDQVKRLLLATVEEDSTVVYYVVHDGVVKPRQN